MSISTVEQLLAAPTLSAAWARASIDSENTDTYGALWAPGAPSGTPGQQYVNDANSLMTFPNVTGLEKWLRTVGASMQSNQAGGCLWLLDRLVGVGSVLVNSTGDKTVDSTSLPRYTDGVDVWVFLECSVIGSTTAPVVSLSSYTDQDGNTGQAGGTVTFPTTTTDVGTVVGPMPLASGDYGVRAVSTINVATAAGGSAAVNVLLMKPLIRIPLGSPTNSGLPDPLEYNAPKPHLEALVEIFDGASIVGLLEGYTGSENVMGYASLAVG